MADKQFFFTDRAWVQRHPEGAGGWSVADDEGEIRFAQAVRIGDLIYVAGQVAWDRDGEIVGKGDLLAQSQASVQEHLGNPGSGRSFPERRRAADAVLHGHERHPPLPTGPKRGNAGRGLHHHRNPGRPDDAPRPAARDRSDGGSVGRDGVARPRRQQASRRPARSG